MVISSPTFNHVNTVPYFLDNPLLTMSLKFDFVDLAFVSLLQSNQGRCLL